MGTENAVMPQTPVGPQPNQGGQTQNSFQPQPSMMAQASSQIPNKGPMPAMAPGQPKPPQAGQPPSDINSTIDQLNSSASKLPSSVSNFLDQLNGAAEQHVSNAGLGAVPSESDNLADYFRSVLKDDVQAFKAQFRSGAARNKKEALTGLEQVYGANGVKVQGDDVYVKPEGQKTFRKLDDTMIDGIADLIGIVGKSAGNVARQVPQMAGQGAGAIAGAGVGGLIGGPPGAIVGAGVGGAAGTYLGIKTGQALEDAQAESLKQKDPYFKYKNQYDTWLNSLNSDPVQSIIGGAAGAIGTHIALKSADKVEAALNGLTEPQNEAIKSLNPEQDTWARTQNALQEHRDIYLPANQSETSASKQVMDAATAEKMKVGQKADMITSKAQQLATANPEQPNLSKADSFLGSTKEQLQLHGYKFDGDKIDFTKEPPVRNKEMNDLAGIYDSIQKEAAINPGPYSQVSGGINPEQMRASLNLLAERANFASDNRSIGEKVSGDAWKMLSNDRDMYYSKLLSGTGSEEEQFWNNGVMQDYHQKKLGLDQVEKAIGNASDTTAVGQEANRQSLAQSIFEKAHDSGETLANIKLLAGNDSPAVQNLRGDLFNKVMDASTGNGRVNYKYLEKMTSDSKYDQFWNFIYGGDPTAKDTLKTISRQAQVYSQNGKAEVANSLGSKIGGLLVKIADKWSPVSLAKTGVELADGDKQLVDAVSDNILKSYKDAYGGQQKAAIMKLSNAMDDVKANSALMGEPRKNYPNAKRYGIISNSIEVKGASQVAGQAPTQPNQSANQQQPQPAQ